MAPGVTVARTGGHTPGHSVVRLESNGDRLMFAGDAIFPVSFDHPEWHNGFEHDPEEATRVRLRLMRELAESAGLQMEFALSDVFPETRNCDACLDRVLSAAKALGLETVPMPRLWRASEDFGHFLKECPPQSNIDAK